MQAEHERGQDARDTAGGTPALPDKTIGPI